MFSRRTKRLIALALLIMLLMACVFIPKPVTDTAEKAVDKYDSLIAAYQTAQKEAANGKSCLVLNFANMSFQAQLANNFMVAEANKAEAYRKALADYGKLNQVPAEAAKFEEAQKAYLDENGDPIPSDKLDLAALKEAGALPAQMGLSLQVYATSFVEAPLPPNNPEPVLNAQRSVSESFNMSFACIRTSNEAAATYNTERQQASGDVVARVAKTVGVRDLPDSLPYFELQGPLSPPTAPVLEPKE